MTLKLDLLCMFALFVDCFCVFGCCNQSAVGADYQADLSKHASQTDAAKGFGGKYGVQSDRKDKVGFSTHNIVWDNIYMKQGSYL